MTRPWTTSEEAVDLKGNDRTRVQPQCARMFSEIRQQVLGIKELDDGNPGGNVDGIDVVSIDERVVDLLQGQVGVMLRLVREWILLLLLRRVAL